MPSPNFIQLGAIVFSMCCTRQPVYITYRSLCYYCLILDLVLKFVIKNAPTKVFPLSLSRFCFDYAHYPVYITCICFCIITDRFSIPICNWIS